MICPAAAKAGESRAGSDFFGDHKRRVALPVTFRCDDVGLPLQPAVSLEPMISVIEPSPAAHVVPKRLVLWYRRRCVHVQANLVAALSSFSVWLAPQKNR